MCGRYTLAGSLDQIAARFGAIVGTDGPEGRSWDWQARFNISPGSVVPVVAFNGQGHRAVVPMRWGLHPSWRKDPPEGRPLFNARVETAAEKPSFRAPFKRRRALIPTTGWYEWERAEDLNGKSIKRPHFIFETDMRADEDRRPGEAIFAMAGLWDRWRVDEGIDLLSCTILTTAAQGEMKHLHHRMPVRLPEEVWEAWLDAEANPKMILETMKDASDIGYYEVAQIVNSGRAEGEALIQPFIDV